MSEFMKYWNEQSDIQIVSLLFEINDSKLKTIIDIEDSINNLGNNIYEVIQVTYLPGKERNNLIQLVKLYDE